MGCDIIRNMKTNEIALGVLFAGLALAANAGDVEAREDALSAGRVIIPGNSNIKISSIPCNTY